MIGGTVTDVWKWTGDTVAITVRNDDYPAPCYLLVCIEKDDNSLSVARGDSIWWQGPYVLWTPMDRSLVDVKIKRISYSSRVPRSMTPDRETFINNQF